MFLLDTDHIVILQRQTQPEYGRLRHKLGNYPSHLLFLSIVSFHELVMGANAYLNRATSEQGLIRGYQMLEQDLTDFAKAQVLPFDRGAWRLFDLLRGQKIRIGTMDLRIAAIGLSRSFVVLTRNLKDFNQVPGLKVEDWTV